MRRIPKSFQIGPHTVRVRMVSEEEMEAKAGESCYGLFTPDRLEVLLLRPHRGLKASVVAQTFWHEFSHVLLWAISHKDYANEKVVDAMGNNLAQAVSSFSYT